MTDARKKEPSWHKELILGFVVFLAIVFILIFTSAATPFIYGQF